MKNEIIRMAREVGFDDYELDDMLLRFASLVDEYVCKREHKWMSEVLGVLPISNENQELMRDTIRARGKK